MQADARIAWLGEWCGPLTVVDDDGVGDRAVIAPNVNPLAIEAPAAEAQWAEG